jgi:hypothetical protein
MKTIGLVSCVSRKVEFPSPAEQLYASPLFDGLSYFARTRVNEWFVLSAKYGLVKPHQVIDPYDETLKEKSREERLTWADSVLARLPNLRASDRVVFLAGSDYRRDLDDALTARGILTAAPLSELGIGRQVSWLRRLQAEHPRVLDLDRLYSILRRLRGAAGESRTLSTTVGASNWPTHGVYFFFEDNQYRMLGPFEHRVVRVGTHAVSAGSKSSLWGRVRTHRGGADGRGNHRGSIFRLHVGNALRVRGALEQVFSSWGKGQSASADVRLSEELLELEVSEFLGRTSVLHVNVPGPSGPDSDRAYIERNVVALLAGPTGPLDLPSRDWLGNDSVHESIRLSGMWNVNFVRDVYDPRVLDVLEAYVDLTLGGSAPKGSLAPIEWRQRIARSTTQYRQNRLF